MNSPEPKLHLRKWFLDFTSTDGSAMIFYAAELKWHSLKARYTSWLNFSPAEGVQLRSRYSKVQFPQIKGDVITWKDVGFGVSGSWISTAGPISARLYDSSEGYLDWNCHQPRSSVELSFGGRISQGIGYAEELILTALPWKIPMNELRWGRFGSESNYMVWIELREKETKQWLWMNGEKLNDCHIEDHCLQVPEKSLELHMNRGVTLESEKKLVSVVGKIIRYLPGFNRIIPVKFLMADEIKWLSNGILKLNGQIDSGMAIHEFVNFNPD